MKLSIITVNYNHKLGLLRTIESVADQEYDDFEYIVIDGGSNDGTDKILQQCEEHGRFKHLIWLSEPDMGTYDAMNKGLARATGDYLLFLNSGDALVSKRVIGKVFSKPREADLIVCRQYQVRDGHRRATHRVRAEDIDKHYLLSNTLPHQATFIRRDLLQRVGGYQLNYPIVADWVFWYDAVVNHGARVQCLSTFVADMEEEGISADVDQCHAEMAHYLRFIHPTLTEDDWMERIEENAMAYQYKRANGSRLGRLLLRLAVRLSK